MEVYIVSPEEEVWQGEADMVVARSPEGEFAILRGHIPFLAALVPGLIKVTSGSATETFVATGGILEASGTQSDYHVIVLADDAENVGDIPADEALRRIGEARRKAEEKVEDLAEAEMRVALASPHLGREH